MDKSEIHMVAPMSRRWEYEVGRELAEQEQQSEQTDIQKLFRAQDAISGIRNKLSEKRNPKRRFFVKGVEI